MSNAYYNELWLIARNDLEKLLELDRKVQARPPTRKKQDALDLILPNYLRYRNLAKRLIVCHDQMVQTQKRDLIKRVLDCTIGRILEYKREIVNWEFTDYQWPDDLLNVLKFTPDDIEITVSAIGKDLVQQRRKQFQELIENAHTRTSRVTIAQSHTETSAEDTRTESQTTGIHQESQTLETRAESQVLPSRHRLQRRKLTKQLSEEPSISTILRETPEETAAREARFAAEKIMRDAIVLIQSHERARVSRCVGYDIQHTYEYNSKIMSGEIEPKKIDTAKWSSAARKIQRAWRRYVARRALRKRIARREEILGMTLPSWQSREVFEKDEGNFQKKLEIMPTLVARKEKATTEERARLLKIRGPGLIEDITDEIREWFVIWYNELGHFDVYPAAKLGGSVLIATGQTLTPQEYLAQKKTKETEKKGGKGKTTANPGERTRPRGREAKLGWKMPQTRTFSFLEEANRDFIEDWSFYDDSSNPDQKERMDLIKNELCYELQLEMREIVDELMKLELTKLNQALIKDHARDNKKLDIPMTKKSKKKKKKRKKGKKRRKKGPMDDVPVEDLFKELAKDNIIRNYPVTSLKMWIGDRSYQNYEAARELREYKHRMGEIKQVVMEYCVLPLTSKEVHRLAPLTRAVCICGTSRCGKSFLVNAICSEVGALLFDMTPEVLVDKYVGRRNEQKLINMISKVARAYAPSIIFIDNGEKPWAKKVPTEEQYYQPRRFARYYPRFVKSIKRGDQILFLTTSSAPYKARRPFIRIHDKFIMIPHTDYNTLYMFYKDVLMKYHGVDRNIDVSCLARMSVGIPLEFIKHSIDKVLSIRRRITLKFQPVTPQEIMQEVMTYEALPAKTLRQFNKFEGRTPLGRKRKRLLAREKAEQQQLAAQKKQAKKARR